MSPASEGPGFRIPQVSIHVQSLLLDSVRESVIAADKEGRVTFWNRGAEMLFGYSAENAIGSLFSSLAYPSGQEAIEFPQTSGRWKGRPSWHSQVLRRRQDGSEIWTDVFVSMITDEAGNRAGWVAIHRDITELRRKEALLRESREQLRNLSSSLMDVRESERSSLARELHDNLGQLLTRLKIDLCWLTEQVPRRLQNGRVSGMTALVDQMVETVRHVSAELRPPILDLGLDSAIEWQVQEFARWNNCRCKAHVRLAQAPADRIKDTAVFRVIQEALTNIARHAKAREVTVRATSSRRRISVRVADDGVGLPCGTSSMSLGLIGMRERVESLGGRFEIRRGRPKGTTVSFYIPISPVDQRSKDLRHDSASYSGRSSGRP
jgi:PAS domain S-box-containing protein